MQFAVFGVNYNNSSLAIREKLAVSAEKAKDALSLLRKQSWVDEALILSTCNRTEFYIISDQPCEQHYAKWLIDYAQVSADITDMLYVLKDIRAIEHLLKVASGLDSMVRNSDIRSN